MNILMALAQLELTGSETYAVSISDELIRRGHNVYIFSDTLTKQSKAEYFQFPFCRRNIFSRINNVFNLQEFIKNQNIDLVHAHARTSGWISYFACRICRIPMITTLHGRQAVHFTKKIFPAFGDYAIAVCDLIKTQVIDDLKVDPNKIEVLHNGIDTKIFSPVAIKRRSDKPIVSLIGRLTGPRGQIALTLMREVFEYDKYHVRVVGNDGIPIEFDEFTNRVEFAGIVDNVSEHIAGSDVVVGGGKMAVEAMMMGRPVVAVGESRSFGLIDDNNIDEAISCNFGDIALENKRDFNLTAIKRDINRGIVRKYVSDKVHEQVIREFGLVHIVDRLEEIYQEQVELKSKSNKTK